MARTPERQSADACIRAVRRALWRDGRKRLIIDRRRPGAREHGRYAITSPDGAVIMGDIDTLSELELAVTMHAITCQCGGQWSYGASSVAADSPDARSPARPVRR